MNGCYSDYHIEGVFDSEDAANRLLALVGADGQVDEWTLNERENDQSIIIYRINLDVNGNEMDRYSFTRICTRSQAQRGEFTLDLSWGESSISFDHALKLAAEARQARLREQLASTASF
jgi:hypothetical protein